jgi:D-arabinose 1-dehydrogenase-like Zn-dependent alcohol dehydrogenase
MKAIVIRQLGGPEVLEYADAPEPEAGAGEALVRVAATSINPIDILERAGLTKDFNPIKLPYVPGWDLSGTVVRVGPGVDGASAGDKVLAWASHIYAERCAVKAELLAKVPDGRDLVEASALPLVTTTGAELIAVAAGVKGGQSVLVSGACGGVGRSAVFATKGARSEVHRRRSEEAADRSGKSRRTTSRSAGRRISNEGSRAGGRRRQCGARPDGRTAAWQGQGGRGFRFRHRVAGECKGLSVREGRVLRLKAGCANPSPYG